MLNAVPTLSAKGWVEDIEIKADRLSAYFFVSEYSQTLLYPGQVSSLPYLVAMFGHDRLRCATQTEDTLRALFSRYYEQVEVTVTTADLKNRQNGQYNLIVDLNVVQGKYRYSLGKLISVADGKILEILEFNNGIKP